MSEDQDSPVPSPGEKARQYMVRYVKRLEETLISGMEECSELRSQVDALTNQYIANCRRIEMLEGKIKELKGAKK